MAPSPAGLIGDHQELEESSSPQTKGPSSIGVTVRDNTVVPKGFSMHSFLKEKKCMLIKIGLENFWSKNLHVCVVLLMHLPEHLLGQ